MAVHVINKKRTVVTEQNIRTKWKHDALLGERRMTIREEILDSVFKDFRSDVAKMLSAKGFYDLEEYTSICFGHDKPQHEILRVRMYKVG